MLFGIETKVIWNITDFSSRRGISNLCFFSSRCKEDCDGRSLWPSDRECSSRRFISRPKRDPQTSEHQECSHQLCPSNFPWTSKMEWGHFTLGNCTSSEQGRIQIVSGMFVRDSSIVVSLCQLQRLPYQPWMERTHQDHGGKFDEPERHPHDDER